ncbi:MAG: T9SS type A sorting domain-containing protein [Ignavibacteria bacterium]|nr:T9SS type A sorting domain-containing protein [Ignavibacteria bacterium]
MKKIILILSLFLIFFIDCEAQWYSQQSGTTNTLYDIEFINDRTGWCSGDGGYIIKTTNGGENWLRQGFGITFEPLFGIHPVDSNVVYAAGFYRTLVKTTNGGKDWMKVESGMQGDGNYTCVFFIDENKGWMGNFDSPDYGVRRTTNGGQTVHASPYNSFPADLFFKDEQNGIGVGGLSNIYHTSNAGINWSSYSIIQTGDFYRLSFINNNTGFTASHKAVYKTTNFGNSWDSVGYIPAFVYSVSFSDDKVGYAGTAYAILKTTTGGRDWSFQIATGVVYNIHSKGKDLIWTCGNAGRIWHTTNGGMSFINNISTTIPDDFELFQNYPNPFNNKTIIKLEIIKMRNYEMEIFNIAGKKIETIFNGDLNTGQYQIIYDAKELSSGIYFYRFSGNNISETKKLILIK